MIRRRRFLRGATALALALPLLESVKFTEPAQAAPGRKVYSVWVRNGNGVAQGLSRGEPDRFWPSAHGALTQELLSGRDSGRAISEFAAYADKMLVVSGTKAGFNPSDCDHAGAINQCLTAGRPGGGRFGLGDHESVDWLISRRCNPEGTEPLNLYVGPYEGDPWISHGLSYRGPRDVAPAENVPFNAYMDLVGGGLGDPGMADLIGARRSSVNDFVRDEMDALRNDARLGSADKTRLSDHFDLVRDMEVRMTCDVDAGAVSRMEAIRDRASQNDNILESGRHMMDVIALTFACDLNRVATLQVGTGNDGTTYLIDGERSFSSHKISHRANTNGGFEESLAIANADVLHHKIDRLHAQNFRHLLDRLDSYMGPGGGTLLDDCTATWTNDLGEGLSHHEYNLPHVIVGGGAGFLKTGEYIDVRRGGEYVSHNKLLNTFISAHGIEKDGGGYYDSFGHDTLEGGVLDALIA